MPAQVNLQTLQVISKQPEGYPSTFNGISNFRNSSESIKEDNGWFKCVFNNAEYNADTEKRSIQSMTFDSSSKRVIVVYAVDDLTEEELNENLEVEKIKLKSEITKQRDEKENAGFPYMGKKFDSDDKSVIRINTAVSTAIAVGQSFSIVWTAQDNSYVSMDYAGMLGMPAALAQYANTLHVKSRVMKDAIDLMTDINDVRNFNIDWS